MEWARFSHRPHPAMRSGTKVIKGNVSLVGDRKGISSLYLEVGRWLGMRRTGVGKRCILVLPQLNTIYEKYRK